MSSLKELVDRQGWAKVSMESIIFIDKLQSFDVKCDLLPIFYIKIHDDCFLKLIMTEGACDSHESYLICNNDLDFDSMLIDSKRPVLDDGLKYADSFNPSPVIPIPEPGKPHYRNAILCDDEIDLPIKVMEFIQEEVLVGYNHVA